jgi:hypothetical protein
MDDPRILHPLDQGQCGSCWAFATATVVGDHFRILGPRTSDFPSPTAVLSCLTAKTPDNCMGCKGAYDMLQCFDTWASMPNGVKGVECTAAKPLNQPCQRKPAKCDYNWCISNAKLCDTVDIASYCGELSDDKCDSPRQYKLKRGVGLDGYVGGNLSQTTLNYNAVATILVNLGPLVAAFTVALDFMDWNSQWNEDDGTDVFVCQMNRGVCVETGKATDPRENDGSHAISVVGYGWGYLKKGPSVGTQRFEHRKDGTLIGTHEVKDYYRYQISEDPADGREVLYWIARNSWSHLVGDHGCFRIVASTDGLGEEEAVNLTFTKFGNFFCYGEPIPHRYKCDANYRCQYDPNGPYATYAECDDKCGYFQVKDRRECSSDPKDLPSAYTTQRYSKKENCEMDAKYRCTPTEGCLIGEDPNGNTTRGLEACETQCPFVCVDKQCVHQFNTSGGMTREQCTAQCNPRESFGPLGKTSVTVFVVMALLLVVFAVMMFFVMRK